MQTIRHRLIEKQDQWRWTVLERDVPPGDAGDWWPGYMCHWAVAYSGGRFGCEVSTTRWEWLPIRQKAQRPSV